MVVVRDIDGNTVLREAGALSITIVFDTLGDSRPGEERQPRPSME